MAVRIASRTSGFATADLHGPQHERDVLSEPGPSTRASYSILVLLIAAGAILRLWGVRFALPNPFGRPDEEVIVDVALGVFSDPNPHFFDWPSLFMYATSAAYAALFAIERAIGGSMTSAAVAKAALEPVLYLTPRLLSVTAGVLTIPVLYGAVSELLPRRVALVAAAFLAFAFLHVRDSHFGVTDVSMTFLLMCAFWAGLRCATRGVTPARAAVAGMLCGLAVSTKYSAALIVLPVVAAIVLRTLWERPRSPEAAVRALGSLLLCAVLAFVAGTPFSVLDRKHFVDAVSAVRGHLAGGHVVMARGWTYHAAFTFRYGLGVPLAIAALLGSCWLAARERWKAVLVLIFPLTYYAVLGSGLTVFVRYMLPIVPFLCLTAGYFVDRVAAAARTRLSPGLVGEAAIVVLLTAIIAAPTAGTSVAFDRLMAVRDTRVLGENWVAARFPDGASIYQSGYGYSHVLPRPIARYTSYTFNERLNRFQMIGGATIDLPDLIVLPESPLGTYTQVPPKVASIVQANYVLAQTFEGASTANAPHALYDQDDAFFAPFAGIEDVVRPGPTVRIFERKPH
jgi:dolichyl-phosphate-mannose-protein mannosyltransferase